MCVGEGPPLAERPINFLHQRVDRIKRHYEAPPLKIRADKQVLHVVMREDLGHSMNGVEERLFRHRHTLSRDEGKDAISEVFLRGSLIVPHPVS